MSDTPLDRLARLYVEPTNRCNLECCTCMRQGWEESLGSMDFGLFEKIVRDLRAWPSPPDIFLGGYGEPLSHPRIAEMIASAKQAGCRVELITNGILLDRDMADRLAATGLDCLWVSIDGASPQSYADVRLGDHLPHILHNLERLRRHRDGNPARRPELGISFVALKRNIGDLSDVLALARQLGATRFSLSNVEPYAADMAGEILYARSLKQPMVPDPGPFPRMDDGILSTFVLEQLADLLPGSRARSVLQEERTGSCPFLERRSASVRWDGRISPCLPLLHSHSVHFGNFTREWMELSFGSVAGREVQEIWNDPVYRDLRRRLSEFSFAPCLSCNSCDLPSVNGEDCFGNTHPACGGCLWSQGFISCP